MKKMIGFIFLLISSYTLAEQCHIEAYYQGSLSNEISYKFPSNTRTFSARKKKACLDLATQVLYWNTNDIMKEYHDLIVKWEFSKKTSALKGLYQGKKVLDQGYFRLDNTGDINAFETNPYTRFLTPSRCGKAPTFYLSQEEAIARRLMSSSDKNVHLKIIDIEGCYVNINIMN